MTDSESQPKELKDGLPTSFHPLKITRCFGCARRLGQNVTCNTWCGTTPVYMPINFDTNRQYLQGQNNTPSVKLIYQLKPWKPYLSKGSPPCISHEKKRLFGRGPITPGIGDLQSPWLKSSCYASPKMGGFPYLLDNTHNRGTQGSADCQWLRLALMKSHVGRWWSNMVIKVDVAVKLTRVTCSLAYLNKNMVSMVSLFSATLLIFFRRSLNHQRFKVSEVSQHLPHLQTIETVVQELVAGDEKMYRLRLEGSWDPSSWETVGDIPSMVNISCHQILHVDVSPISALMQMTYDLWNSQNKNTPLIASSLITTYL